MNEYGHFRHFLLFVVSFRSADEILQVKFFITEKADGVVEHRKI